jgi:hypothetical protein
MTMAQLTSHLKQLSDGNGDGTVMGQSSQDAISFFGAAPVVQRAGGNQVQISQAAANGVCININSVTLTTLGVSTFSTALTTLTLTGASVLLSSDHVIVNKITNTQAGLGIANMRAGVTAGTIVANYVNLGSTATITTAAESYLVVALRGVAGAATLTPSSLAPSQCFEQVFTVTGLAPGMLVNAVKPTDQNVALAGCRVVGNNQIGITFLNPTNTTITPTAAESYSIVALNGLNPVCNLLTLGVNIGALASATSTSVTEQNITVSGILATDVAVGPPMRAAWQSSNVPIMSRITAANVLAVTMLDYSGTAAANPTAQEVWMQTINRMAPAAPLQVYSVTLTPTAVGPQTTVSQGFTVTGLVASTPVLVNKPSGTSGVGIVGYRVSAANVLEILFANPTTATITPPVETYLVGNFPTVCSTSNLAVQMVSVGGNQNVNLTNEIRATLVGNGMIAGA